jgi:glycosyltransferase involved in cell wall biosynthesis
MATSRTVIVVAAYNEAASIAQVLASLLPTYPDVVVVDDGSEDLTAQIALEQGAVVLRHPVNLGQGAALQTGILYALEMDADYIATFDADGQHCPEDVGTLMACLLKEGTEAVLGSRFLGRCIGISAGRRIFLRLAVLLTWLMTGVRLSDAHNGLRLFTRSAAQRLRIKRNRMAHATEIVIQLVRQKIPFCECPVVITYTPYSVRKGQSNLHLLRILLELAPLLCDAPDRVTLSTRRSALGAPMIPARSAGSFAT